MGNLMLVLEDHTGSRRVVTATGKDYAEDMRLLNTIEVKAAMHGWTVVKVKRNGRNYHYRKED